MVSCSVDIQLGLANTLSLSRKEPISPIIMGNLCPGSGLLALPLASTPNDATHLGRMFASSNFLYATTSNVRMHTTLLICTPDSWKTSINYLQLRSRHSDSKI